MGSYLTLFILIALTSLTVFAQSPTLLEVAESGDHAAAIRLVSAKGTDVNAFGPDGTTPLMYAAANDDLVLVRALIQARANVKAKNKFGTSAITEASIIGSARIIDALIKAGADPNYRTPYGETPLLAAARSGNVDAAKVLLNAGADINAKESWGEQTALMWAAAQRQEDMVKYLVARGARLNDHGKFQWWERTIIKEPRLKFTNKGGLTPLHYAVREGCEGCVKTLLAAGADANSEMRDGETPLIVALLNLHFDTAALLIKGGADLNKWDLFGRTPIYVVTDRNTLPTQGMTGERVVLPSPDRLTALEIARMMLERGANPNIQLKRRPPYVSGQDREADPMLAQGATPLLRAARTGDSKFVALLLEFKALVDLPNKEGITPLMAAAGVDYGQWISRGRYRSDEDVLATISLLLKAGANVNARTVIDLDDLDTHRFWNIRGGPRDDAKVAATTELLSKVASKSAEPGLKSCAPPNPGALDVIGFTKNMSRLHQVPSVKAVPHETALHGAATQGFHKFVEVLLTNAADPNIKDAFGCTPLESLVNLKGV